MSVTQFDRDQMARWYAEEHFKIDSGLELVCYLPKNAGEREIRLVEVNNLLGQRTDDSLEPIGFGIDRGMESEHKLVVVDATPDQWKRIEAGEPGLLPGNWSLDGMVVFR